MSNSLLVSKLKQEGSHSSKENLEGLEWGENHG